MNSRMGKFYITQAAMGAKPQAVKLVMAQCLIYRCEFYASMLVFEYEACCDLFDELPLGQALPTYEFTVNEDNSVTVEKLTD